MSFEIDVDVSPLLNLTGKLRRQMPFIIATSLNTTAFEARATLKRELPKHFILRNRFSERSLHVWKAAKGDTQASVGTKAPYMAALAKAIPGTTETAQGKAFSIPQAVRTSTFDIVKKSKWPARLLKKKRYYIDEVPGQPDKTGVWERPKKLGKRRLGPAAPPRLMFLFAKKIKVRKKWPLHETTVRVTNKTWAKACDATVARAIKTAR